MFLLGPQGKQIQIYHSISFKVYILTNSESHFSFTQLDLSIFINLYFSSCFPIKFLYVLLQIRSYINDYMNIFHMFSHGSYIKYIIFFKCLIAFFFNRLLKTLMRLFEIFLLHQHSLNSVKIISL